MCHVKNAKFSQDLLQPNLTLSKMTDDMQTPTIEQPIDEPQTTPEETPGESQNATDNGEGSEQQQDSSEKSDPNNPANASFDPYNLPEHARMPFPPPPGFPHPMHSTSLVTTWPLTCSVPDYGRQSQR